MASSGTNVTKTSIVNDFNSAITNVANAGVAYTLASNPFTSHGATSYANANLSNAYATTMVTGVITDSDVVATSLNSVLRNYAYNATRIRNTFFRYNNKGSYVDWGTGITLLNDSYRTDPGGAIFGANPNQADANTSIDAAELIAFMTNLQSAYNTARSTLVTLTACHTSCHSSCHGSRGRR